MPPIPVELCVGGRDLTEPRLSPDAARIGWVESVAGRARILVRDLSGGAPSVLAEVPAPRPGRGLGGGCWCWTPDGASIVYAAADGNLWHRTSSGAPRPLTDLGPRIAQAPVVAADGTFVAFVVDQAELWRVGLVDLVLERLDDASADFCFDPAIAPDSASVVWQAWNAPDMPWDGARMEQVTLDGMQRSALAAAGGALQQPRLVGEGRAMCVRDDTGWMNVWSGDAPVAAEPYEHASPTWGLGQRSYAPSPDGRRIAFTRNERGFGRLCIADVANGDVTEVARGVHGQLSWEGSSLAALRTGARTPTQVVVYDTARGFARQTVDVGPSPAWAAAELVEPELVEIPAGDGFLIHARLYRADQATGRLLCWLHGGPTDQWQVTFMPRIAFWRSRGWNVLVPDHRGSTGHGRAYQQALRGRWGELDVDDTVRVLRHAHAHGWATPAATALFGGSSGGFTVLGVVAAEGGDCVACAVVSYPVTDLADLAERSHRFERHYTQTLVAPAAYAARSPVTFAERISTPLLVFHGSDDPVVPVAQSRALVERMRVHGADVELVVYPGEGHGFRQEANQMDEYRRIEAFLALHT